MQRSSNKHSRRKVSVYKKHQPNQLATLRTSPSAFSKLALHHLNYFRAVLGCSVLLKQGSVQLEERVSPCENRKHLSRLVSEARNVQRGSQGFSRSQLRCLPKVYRIPRDQNRQ